jgi:membrane fusion protein, multidrug efflux system
MNPMPMTIRFLLRTAHWLPCVFLVLALSGLPGCSSAAPPSEASAAPTPPPPVTVSAPATTPEKDDLYVASGPIVVENQVDVLAEREGMVAKILADVGTSVRKGQLLALLDDRQLSAEQDAVEAKVHTGEADMKDWEAETKVAESDYTRAKKMRDAGINTQEELDHARYKFEGSQYEVEKSRRQLENARANLRSSELELQKTRIVAPFDGVVARRYVRAGQKVTSGGRLFWVSAVAPLLVKFTLPESLINKVKRGDVVEVSVASDPAAEHPAKIVQLSPVVDPASDSIDVMAELQGKPADVRPGMTASVRLRAPVSRPR